MGYIDKFTLATEIEKLKDKVSDSSSYCNGWQHTLRMLEIELNTLEVKEVDLKKEIDDAFLENKCNITDNVSLAEFVRIAKHFFELGMQASNPITATDRGTAEEIIVNLKRVEQDYHINLTREMEWLRNQVKKGE